MGKNLIQQARGKGGPRYRAPSFNYEGEARLPRVIQGLAVGTVTDLVKSAGHLAPLARITFIDGTSCLFQAPDGIVVGQEIQAGQGASIKHGNVLKLRDIPEGTIISNIELNPGDGGRFCRTSGTAAKLLSKTEKTVTIMLPSRKEKTINADCRAVIGGIAGSGRVEKPFLKAGTMHHFKRIRNKRYPNPSGAAQNAVDHPFGNKRTSRKAKQKPVGHFAPPGRKVGKLWPRRTGQKK